MTDDSDTHDDDADLFRQMMEDVTPLSSDNRIEPATGQRAAHVHKQSVTDASSGSRSQSGLVQREYVTPVQPDETLFFAHPGLQEKVRKRLRLGQIAFEARLDLHGKTIAQAGQLLDSFLQQAQQEGMRCVLVIHGRGHRSLDNEPVLKAQINHWLREHTSVLAFASAQPKHGGVGAVYVLLRKPT